MTVRLVATGTSSICVPIQAGWMNALNSTGRSSWINAISFCKSRALYNGCCIAHWMRKFQFKYTQVLCLGLIRQIETQCTYTNFPIDWIHSFSGIRLYQNMEIKIVSWLISCNCVIFECRKNLQDLLLLFVLRLACSWAKCNEPL